jgi:hypothetical protein
LNVIATLARQHQPLAWSNLLQKAGMDPNEEFLRQYALTGGRPSLYERGICAFYALALFIAISTWFIAVRAPLWIDETGSYWLISKGLWEILPRQGSTSLPVYSYFLWFSTEIFGISEIALRVPSILAMLGAVYLLYLAARELFERDIAFIAATVFCLHPIIVFASIDARPYAFAALTTNTAILILLRLRRSNSIWLAALFGLTTACIVWFQYLFINIVPAMVLCFFVIKNCDRRILWRQFGAALAGFTLAFLPVIPGFINLFNTAKSHVANPAPRLMELLWTLAPGWLLITLCIAVFVAFLVRAARLRGNSFNRFEPLHLVLCASLALVPLLILYGVSVGTSLHTFVAHRRVDAIPGIALCWAFLLSRFRSRAPRLLFCLTLVTMTACSQFSSPLATRHESTLKYALEAAEKDATADNAPVLICSGLVEADFETMPIDSAKENRLFAPLSYYKLSVPVVPLPMALNDEAKRVGSSFLQEAAQKHERFLAIADLASYKTLDWLTQNAAATHSVRKLGVFDGVEVLEFEPRSSPTSSSDR